MFRNDQGLSLVEILIASAIVGGIALAVMKLADNMKGIENRSTGMLDAREVLSEVRQIIENDKHCKLSLVNPEGPAATFRKGEVDEPGKDEGLPVELWFGDADGVKRLQKKFQDGTLVGKTTVKSLRLFMNNGAGFDYAPGPKSDLGILRVSYTFPGQGAKILNRDFMLYVDFTTNDSGLSTIQGCDRSGIKPMCESLNMDYDPTTGRCLQPVDTCDDWKVLAEGSWGGWRGVACDTSDGGYVQSLIFGQSRSGAMDNNSMKVKCCYSKKYRRSHCGEPVEVAGEAWWEGDVAVSCSERPRGFVRKLELYQGSVGGKDTNGMRVQCCYPN